LQNTTQKTKDPSTRTPPPKKKQNKNKANSMNSGAPEGLAVP